MPGCMETHLMASYPTILIFFQEYQDLGEIYLRIFNYQILFWRAYTKHTSGPQLKNTCFNSQYFSLSWKRVTWLPLDLSEMNQPAGVINVICYPFLFSSPLFGHLTVDPDQTQHPLLFLLKVLGNIVEGKKLEAKAISANEALDYLWILTISSIPYPPEKNTYNLVSEYINCHEWHKNTSTFQDTFPRAACYRFCLCWCAVPEPQGPAVSSASCCPCRWGWGKRQWSQTPGRVTQVHAENGRERARAKQILGWAQITSHFTSWIKESALEAYIIYNAQIFQMSTQSWGPPHNREQFNEICTEFTRKFTWHSTFVTKFTFVSTCLLLETEIVLYICPPHPSNCWLDQHEQMLARTYPFLPSGIYDYTLFRRKNCGISPFGKILFNIVHVRNLGDNFHLAL